LFFLHFNFKYSPFFLPRLCVFQACVRRRACSRPHGARGSFGARAQRHSFRPASAVSSRAGLSLQVGVPNFFLSIILGSAKHTR
jgi:hypothetical protein